MLTHIKVKLAEAEGDEATGLRFPLMSVYLLNTTVYGLSESNPPFPSSRVSPKYTEIQPEMEYYTVTKKSKLLITTTTWVNFTLILKGARYKRLLQFPDKI